MVPRKRKPSRPAPKKGGSKQGPPKKRELTRAEVDALIRALKALKLQSDEDIRRLKLARKIDPEFWHKTFGPITPTDSTPRPTGPRHRGGRR